MESLPEEKIVEICHHMDRPVLINFSKTSKDNYCICHEILEKEYLKIIDEMLIIVEKAPDLYWGRRLILEATDPNKQFRLVSFCRNYGNGISESYRITEAYMPKFFTIQKLGFTEERAVIQTSGDKLKIKQMLLNLFLQGHLTSKYDFLTVEDDLR